MKKLLMVCLLASSSFGVAAQPQAPDKLSPPTGGGDVTFNRIVVDANNAGDCKAIADVDGDGKPDLIVGGSNLAWYRNPDWIKTVVATPQSEFSTDCQAMDMNGDGRVDLITADGGGTGNVVWLENRATGTWPRHTVGSHGEWAHDIEVADFDGDGKLDVLTHGHGFTHMWYQNGADSWTDRNLTSIGKTNEGIGIGDVDGDGRIDMVQGGWWYKNPQNRTALWTMTQFASGYDGGGYTAAVADINRDGRADIAVINQHSRGEFAWYTGPLNPTQTSWTKNVVSSDIGAHKLTIIDLNGDGSLDFVAGLELTELRIYLSNSAATPTFTSKTINTTGCHNTRVGDVTGDGRVDLLCNNYLGNPPVQLYINQAVGTFLHAGGPCAVAGQSAVQLYVPPDTSPNDNKAASEVFMPKTCAGPAVATFSAWVVAPAGTKILVRMVARCVGSGGQTNNPCTVGQEVAADPGTTILVSNVEEPGQVQTVTGLWTFLKRGLWRFELRIGGPGTVKIMNRTLFVQAY